MRIDRFLSSSIESVASVVLSFFASGHVRFAPIVVPSPSDGRRIGGCRTASKARSPWQRPSFPALRLASGGAQGHPPRQLRD